MCSGERVFYDLNACRCFTRALAPRNGVFVHDGWSHPHLVGRCGDRRTASRDSGTPVGITLEEREDTNAKLQELFKEDHGFVDGITSWHFPGWMPRKCGMGSNGRSAGTPKSVEFSPSPLAVGMKG